MNDTQKATFAGTIILIAVMGAVIGQLWFAYSPVVKKINEIHTWVSVEKAEKDQTIASLRTFLSESGMEEVRAWKYAEERCVCLMYSGGGDDSPKTKEEICNYQIPQGEEYSASYDIQTYWEPND